MSEIKEILLEDHVEVLSSKRIFAADYVERGIPFYRSKETIEKSFGQEISTPLYISEKKFKEIKEKYGAPIAGDILLSAVGERAGIPYYIEENRDFYFKDGNLIWFRNFSESLNSKYLSYFINSRVGQHHLKNLMIGSAQKALTIAGLRSLVIDVPPINEQNQIARTLSLLDQKITLLRQQNQTLEELAQTLFKRWFVDFEFPNEHSKPYKSSGGKMVSSELGEIPEGWRILPLEEYTNVNNGFSYKGSELMESDIAMLTLKNFDRNGGFRYDGFKEIITDRYKDQHVVEVGDLIVAHTDLTQDAEVLGNPALILNNSKYSKLIISMDLVSVRPTNEAVNKEFLYYLMRDKRFKNHCKGYANGTTVLHLSKSAIPEYLFPFSENDNILKEFSKYAKKVNEKIAQNVESIQSFKRIRDLLLPKLMNGELEVN